MSRPTNQPGSWLYGQSWTAQRASWFTPDPPERQMKGMIMFWVVVRDVAEWTGAVWGLALSTAVVGKMFGMSERLWRGAARWHQRLWLFAPIGLLFSVEDSWRGGWHTSWSIVFQTFNAYLWWKYRDWPEDNDWKRRLKKAKSAVSVKLGRLIVVPTS